MREGVAINKPRITGGVFVGSEHPSGRSWAWLMAGNMVLIVVIRFFSENLGVVPGVVQFIDIPLTLLVLLLALLAFVRRGHGADGLALRKLLYIFIVIFFGSCLINSSRVALVPSSLFFFGFAAPLIFAAAIMNARMNREDIKLVLRIFFWLGVLELAMGFFYGFPLFLATNNPDYVSGTFGQNAYQFTYFIGVWFLYVLGGAATQSKEKRRGAGVAIGVVAIAVFVLFYAAQYRAMLLFFTFVILLTLWVSPARVSSRLMLTIVLAGVSVVTLIVIGTSFPQLKLLKVFDLVQDTTPLTQSGKVSVVKNVVRLYGDMPHSALVGTGPATFSSRGFTTFAFSSDSQKDTVSPVAASLMGGRMYATDVAQKYVQSIRDKPIQGGRTAASPFSSYTSLAAEVGLLGLIVYLLAYFKALTFALRCLSAGGRSGDLLTSRLAFTCFGGIVLLLIQAVFDNWLETTRVAIPLWILIGLLFALKMADDAGELQPNPTGGSGTAVAAKTTTP